jgi:Protein of unknown function (DUF4197)
MKKIVISALCISAFGFTACDSASFQKAMTTVLESTEPNSEEVGSGLKEALNLGVTKGVDVLSAKDGFYKSAYKILLPPEARKVTAKLSSIPGFTMVEDVILEKINRGAEDASAKAKPIFVSAIKQMTFADAWNILTGGGTAATDYLREKTYSQLYNEFNPVIVTSLDKFNARQYWGDAVNTYNKIPFLGEKVNPKLDDYVTNEALKGLFSMVAEKEKDIRQNPIERTTELLKKVFSRQDKK